jgi:predicted transcriptional regulator
MFKTNDLLNRLKAVYGLQSDYALAKKIGISRQAVSKYRTLTRTLDDCVAVEVAELLELNPFQVLASMQLERAERNKDEKMVSIWREYAKRADFSTDSQMAKVA